MSRFVLPLFLALAACQASPTATPTSSAGGLTTVEVDGPAAISPAVKACRDRCEVILRPGAYGELGIGNVAPAASTVWVILTGSTFTFARIAAASNLSVEGGKVIGGNQWGQCWVIDGAANVSLANAQADHCATAGFIITRSKTITLSAWTVTAPLCDGVTVSGTDTFAVVGGRYAGMFPTTAGCHADGVQMWGMDGFPLRNGLVADNLVLSSPELAADGRSMGIQGITLFNQRTDQEKITVENNRITVNGGWCIAIFYTREVVARNNSCTNLAPRPWDGRYGWTGSSGTFGPNLLDGVIVNG